MRRGRGFEGRWSPVGRVPALPVEEQRSLARRWRDLGDQAALDRLVLSLARLAARVAHQWARRNPGLDYDDLESEGLQGLTIGCQRWDPERGLRATTYVVWWIRAYVGRYVMQHSMGQVRAITSSQHQVAYFRARKVRDRMLSMGKDGTAEQVAAELGIPLAAVERVLTPRGVLDADVSIEGEADRWEDGLPRGPVGAALVDASPLPEDAVADADEQRWERGEVLRAMNALTVREAAVVRARFMAAHPRTLESIGKRWGVSRERVRQIEARALEKIRGELLAS